MKAKDLLEVLGALAVVGGLLLVAYQINQNTVLTRAQLNSDAAGRFQDMYASLQSENFALVWAKSLKEPTQLSLAEMKELDGHYQRLVDQLLMDRFFFELGIFKVEPREFIADWVPAYFSSRFAKSWWKVNRELYDDSEFVEMMDQEIAKVNTSGDLQYYEALQRELSTEIEP